MTVMINRDTPSRTSRQGQYRPVRRKPWMPGPGEPEHPLTGPLWDINRVLEHYKRRALRAEAALEAVQSEILLTGQLGEIVDAALADREGV